MNNMTVREFIEEHTFEEKMFASAAISGDNKFLNFKEGDLDEAQKEILMRLLATQVVTNGQVSLRMAILAGKAIKSSLEYPIKKKSNWFKDFVKKVLK